MPFDKTPSVQTYQTKDINLVTQFESRDVSNSKDVASVNCFFEVSMDKLTRTSVVNATSRNGTVLYPFTIPSTNVRGAYYWKDQDKLYIAYDQSIAIVTGSTGVLLTTLTPGFAAGVSEVGFIEFNYTTNTYAMVVSDGTVYGTINVANAFTATVSANIPVPHHPNIVALDGYVFMYKVGTADIYNSSLNDPLVFTAGSFITAEMLPETLVRLVRTNNYLVVFGTATIEYFYDAANATGSPLQRNDTPVKFIKYRGGLAIWGNKAYFIASTTTSAPELYMLEDFKVEPLGTPAIKRYIELSNTSLASVISNGGHDFYVLNMGSLTYMMDLETKLWTRLAYQAGTNFPIKFSFQLPYTGYGNTSLLIQTGVAAISMFRNDVYLDNGVDFSPTIITANQMFDTYRKKFGGRLSIIADRPTTSSYLTVSWSDDDYQTFSTGRQVVLNQMYPVLNALGSFNRRAFKLVHTGNSRMRLNKMEIDFNMGSR